LNTQITQKSKFNQQRCFLKKKISEKTGTDSNNRIGFFFNSTSTLNPLKYFMADERIQTIESVPVVFSTQPVL